MEFRKGCDGVGNYAAPDETDVIIELDRRGPLNALELSRFLDPCELYSKEVFIMLKSLVRDGFVFLDSFDREEEFFYDFYVPRQKYFERYTI